MVGQPQQELGGAPQWDPLPLCCQAGQGMSHGMHHLQDTHGQTENAQQLGHAGSCLQLLLGNVAT